MKAIVQDRYGSAGSLELRDIPTPTVRDHDVLLRVAAAGVHRGVWHLMTGQPYVLRVMGFGLRAPADPVRGDEVAGVVEAIGPDVTGFRVGDEVFGTCDGAFAERARATADTLAPKPANISFEQAAVVPVSGVAALRALRDAGGIQAGQRVLLIGASGGVGTFAVQLAKAFGAEVTGVCSTAKVALVRAIGADDVIDYTREDLTRRGRRFDLVLDLGGNRSLSQLRRVLRARGTLVIVGGEGGGRWLGGVDRQLRAALLAPFVGERLRSPFVQTRRADLDLLRDLIEAGKVTPVIDRTYPLAAAPDAIRYLIAGRARGKVALTVGPLPRREREEPQRAEGGGDRSQGQPHLQVPEKADAADVARVLRHDAVGYRAEQGQVAGERRRHGQQLPPERRAGQGRHLAADHEDERHV